MTEPRTTVLIVGYNSDTWLPDCLSTLAGASVQRLNLCFVDNVNNPDLQTLRLSAFSVEVLKTPFPMGFADANNFGLQRTRFESDFILFLNQDTVSTDGWIDECVTCFGSDKHLGILSPGLRTYDLSEWEPNMLACVRESSLADSELTAGTNRWIALRHVTAAAMMIRSDVLNQVGPFDPIFGSYYEDYDLCRRVRNAGYTIGVCPTARVGHFSGSVTASPSDYTKRARAIIRNALIHEVRETATNRLGTLAKHFLVKLPLNIVRGLLKTESSQAISTTIGAHWDLIKIAERLLSRKRDEQQWSEFLTEFQSSGSKIGQKR